MNIPILFENDEVVVIDKPAGTVVHAVGHKKPDDAKETIADWHLARVPGATLVGEPLVLEDGTEISRPGIVHRLDRDTSGVLILAKTQDAFLHLKKQFHDRLVKKEYRAFVYGAVKEAKGVIDRAIGRSTQDFRLRSAQYGARGKLRQAETAWERVRGTERYAYLRLFPKTGRRHQLRVHLKAINHPIVEDCLYAGNLPKQQPHALGFTRLALHAHTLTIALPAGGTRTFSAPFPEDFVRAERLLGEA
jgi:23S rRNA pseudouridine1911/1915/1917 synthase